MDIKCLLKCIRQTNIFFSMRNEIGFLAFYNLRQYICEKITVE